MEKTLVFWAKQKTAIQYGNVEVSTDVECVKGAFVGGFHRNDRNPPEYNLNNCYYLGEANQFTGEESEDATFTNCSNKTEEEMKSDEFVSLLNSGNENPVWKKDTENKNNGYPIFINE